MRVRNHANPFNYFQRMQPLHFAEIFSKFKGTLELEVGFGRGIFIRRYAENHPDRHIVGIEVRIQMAERLKERIVSLKLSNLHLVHGNAQISMEDQFPDNCMDRLFVFHPDPWFKKSHHKRRVINPKFLEVCKKKLTASGRLYISTDVDLLFADMEEKIIGGGFKKIEDPEFWATDYQTHWDEFSKKDQRNTFCGVYSLTS